MVTFSNHKPFYFKENMTQITDFRTKEKNSELFRAEDKKLSLEGCDTEICQPMLE